MRHTLIAFLKKVKEILTHKFRQYDVKLPYLIAIIIAVIIGVGGVNLFIELTDELQTEVLASYDFKITEYIISYRTPFLTHYFRFMTRLGDAHGYLIILSIAAIISYLVFKKWKYVVQTIIVLFLATLSNVVLKRFIDRARPDIEHLVVVKSLSYPSGHAMAAMAFYGFVIYLVYRYKFNIFLKFGIILLLALVILSIGISRIYLGVHFPSDIAGGFIAGSIWVIFCILIFDIIEIFRRDPST